MQFPFPCTHCLQENLKLVADIKRAPTFVCDRCGGIVPADGQEMRAYLVEIEKALDAIGPAFKVVSDFAERCRKGGGNTPAG